LGWKCIARQQWRARIETILYQSTTDAIPASPASNGGRGLKRQAAEWKAKNPEHRPPAMAGAD